KGALGLMQVMPETGAWVARQLSWPEFHPDMLYDPERNLTIGTWYLRHLANTFDGNLVVALAAYNAGQTRVQQWLAEQRWDGREETLADIPFGETRRYVRRVLDTMDTYIWLYDHGREQVSNPAESNDTARRRKRRPSGGPAAGAREGPVWAWNCVRWPTWRRAGWTRPSGFTRLPMKKAPQALRPTSTS